MSHLAEGLLAGKTALITGGGTGLGLAMGREFARLGADLVICGRREEVLRAAASELEAQTGQRVRVIVCDIRSGDAVEAMVEAVFAAQPVDILVNNAAASFIAQTERLSHRAADAILATTLHGALYCTLAVGRRWIDGGTKGVVLSILSTSTVTGRAFTTSSAMAKSGVLAMTRSLAVEWGPHNIRLVAIAPGSFPTPGASAQLNPAGRQTGQARSRTPLGRNGEHSELAELAAFMVSDAAAYMTGEMVVLDGGAHLRSSGAEDLLDWSQDQWIAHRAGLNRGGL